MCLSKGVTVHFGTSFDAQTRNTSNAGSSKGTSSPKHKSSPQPKKVKLNKTRKELLEQKRQQQQRLAALNFQQREDLLDLAENDIEMDDERDWVDEPALAVPPPGEEGFFLSHAGGESTLQQIFVDSLSDQKRCDFRTRQDHIECINRQWDVQLPDLVEAYLQYQVQGPRTSKAGEPGAWSLQVIGLDTRGLHFFAHTLTVPSASVTLIEHGYIGTTPEQPKLAISIQLLTFYQQLQHVCPCFSLDAFAKALNHFHAVLHRLYLADQLSSAYDCYLSIIREMDHKIAQELGRGDSRWAIKNVCAPCLYKTEDEPPLKFSFLAAIDGNNSLKLVDSMYRAGTV